MRVFSALFLLSLFAPGVSEAIGVSAVGAVNYSTPTANFGSNYNSKAALGYGALFEGSIAPGLGLELGVLSLARKYENVSSAETTTQEMIELPLLARFWLGPHLSFGFGGYFSRYTGKIKQGNTEIDYANSTFTENDFGFASSLGIYFQLLSGIKLLVDGRYTIGIADNNSSSAELKFNDLQILTGLRLGF